MTDKMLIDRSVVERILDNIEAGNILSASTELRHIFESASVQPNYEPAFVYAGQSKDELEEAFDGVTHGTAFYSHPINLSCKSTQARLATLATLWGYEKNRSIPERNPRSVQGYWKPSLSYDNSRAFQWWSRQLPHLLHGTGRPTTTAHSSTHSQHNSQMTTKKLYSRDDDLYIFDSVEELLFDMESDGKLTVGTPYYEANSRELHTEDFIDIDHILEHFDEMLYEQVGEVSDCDFSNVSPEAKDELSQLLQQWINKHTNVSSYSTIVGDTKELTVQPKDLKGR